jgi:spore maturation protein SpmB
VNGVQFGDLLRDAASTWLLPVLIVVMLGYGVAKRVAVYDAMIAGAQEGFQVAVRIIPFLVAIIVAAGMFRASGLLDGILSVTSPVLNSVGFPPAALPMAILRPLSGSGAYAVMAEIMQAEGPDSQVGYLVSTLQGSTETTFYVLAVYFGAVAVTRVRHAVAAGLIADVAGVIGAVLAVKWFLPG